MRNHAWGASFVADRTRSEARFLATGQQNNKQSAAPRRQRAVRRRVTARFFKFSVGVILIVAVYFYAGVYWQIIKLDKQIVSTRNEIEVMRQRNQQLAAEIKRLGSDRYVEEMARDLGLIKPGEQAYAIVEPQETDSPFYVPQRSGVSSSNLYH